MPPGSQVRRLYAKGRACMSGGSSHDQSIAAYVDVVPLQDAVVQAAKEFVASTSYFRQRKESRPEFERLAFAILDLRKAEDANT